MLSANPPPLVIGTPAHGRSNAPSPHSLNEAWPDLERQQARWQQKQPKVFSPPQRSRQDGSALPVQSQLPLQTWRATPAQIRNWQKRGQLALPGKGGIPGNLGLLRQALGADTGLVSVLSGLDQQPLPPARPLSEMVLLAGIEGNSNTATALGMQLAQIMKTYSPGDMPVRLFNVSMSFPITGPAVFHHALRDGDQNPFAAARESMNRLRQQLSDFIYRVATPSLNPVEASVLDEEAFLKLASPLIEGLSDQTLRTGGRKLLATYGQAQRDLLMQVQAWWRGIFGQLADMRGSLQRAGGASLLAVPASEVRTLLGLCSSDGELLQLAGDFLAVLQLSVRL